MQQHPVPQNVTSYQFRLVGDMTLKQFLELGAGLVVAYLFYASNLIFFIKWPLVIFFGLLGVALAFFPIEERPLDRWIINFIKAIYTPTRYLWKKSTATPSFFNFEPHKAQPTQTTVVEKKQSSNPALDKALETPEEVDESEQSKLSSLDRLFNEITSNAPSPQVTPKQPAINKPSVSVRKLRPSSSQQPTRGGVLFRSSSPNSTPPPLPKPPSSPPPSLPKENREVVVPENQPLKIEKALEPKKEEVSSSPAGENVLFSTPTATKHSVKGEVIQAQTSTSAQMPPSPSSSNIVVGTVTDSQDRIVGSAIVQIIDDSGIPQRAVKTNDLGHFFIATPLRPGNYVIETEKPSLNFPPQKLTINNQVVPPIKIQASS